jgi:hypothetical protein
LGADNSVFAVIGTLQYRPRLSNRTITRRLQKDKRTATKKEKKKKGKVLPWWLDARRVTRQERAAQAFDGSTFRFGKTCTTFP